MQIRSGSDSMICCDMCGRRIFSNTFKTEYEDVNKVMPDLCLDCATNINTLFESLYDRQIRKRHKLELMQKLNKARKARLNSKG